MASLRSSLMGIFKENYCCDLLVWFQKVHTLSASLGLFFLSLLFLTLPCCTCAPSQTYTCMSSITEPPDEVQRAVFLPCSKPQVVCVHTQACVMLSCRVSEVKVRLSCHPDPMGSHPFSFTSSTLPSHSIISDHIGCTVGCVAVSCFLFFFWWRMWAEI